MAKKPRQIRRTAGGKRTVKPVAKKISPTTGLKQKITAPFTAFGGWLLGLLPDRVQKWFQTNSKWQLLLRAAGGGALLVFLVFLFYAKDLPSPSKVNAIIGASTTRFYDRTGQTLLYELYGDKNRTIIGFDQMPKNIKDATIAVEDRNFYKHGAFSALSLLRAAFVDLFHRHKGLQGGSTITQQYVKNALLDPTERSISRKIKELILSIEIEQFYKKDDILKLYLNEIPYGTQAYGIQAAAKTYFNKDAKQLTLDEAALLAAIPRAPTFYSPYGQHRDALVSRQRLILDLMAEQKLITKDQAQKAKKVDTLAKIPARPAYFANVRAPHFVLYVQELLEQKYGSSVVTQGGLKVITSLDLDKQKKAEEAIAGNMNQVRSLGGSNAALVAGDPKNGQILAMVGSYDFNDPDFGAYNVAIADRQPGSSFKPYVYATAWAKNWGPGSTLYDVLTDFGGGYTPTNYTSRNYGVLSMRSAIGGSLNIPAVKTLYIAGVENSIKTAHDMGITTLNDPSRYGLSLVLGSGEVKLADMVNGYEGFANQGIHHDPVAVLKITDPKGRVLEEYKPDNGKRVIDQQVAYLMSNVLSDNNAKAFIFGYYPPFIFGNRPVAVKTGTTENFKDAWTMGYTPSLVSGVWVGNNDGRSMGGAAGAIAAPIFHDFMAAALDGTPVEQFTRPPGIKEVTLDADTGRLPTDTTKNRRTDIFASWYKPIPATATKSAEIDKVSGKLATSCTPPLAKETKYSSEIHAEIPPDDPAYGRWEPPVQALAASLGYQQGGNLPTTYDDVHKCSDKKPKVDLSVTQNDDSSTYTIEAGWTSGTFSVNKLDIYLDGQIISTQSVGSSSTNPYTFDYNMPTGQHTIKAVATDKGYYTGEDSQTLTVTATTPSGGSLEGLTPADGSHAGPGVVSFSWSSYAGANKYNLYWRRGTSGSWNHHDGITDTSVLQNIGLATGTYYWYVEAFLGSNLLSTSSVLNFIAP